MAAPNKQLNMLSELQRAAFEKWKSSKDYMELALELQQSKRASDVKGEDGDCHVDVALEVREDGNVDVLLSVSGRPKLPDTNELQDFMDISTSPYPAEDLLNTLYEGHIQDGMSVVDLDKPQKLSLYFLELERLKAIKDLEVKEATKCGSLKTYESGLSELQHAAFARWTNNEEINEISTTKLPALNFKDEYSIQPTMGNFKEDDPNSVLELEPLLNEVALQQ